MRRARMDLLNISDSVLRDELITLLLALGAGVAAFAVAYGLTSPPRGKPRPGSRFRLEGKPIQRIEIWLDEQQMGISAPEYIRQSLMLGVPLGLGMFVMIGSVVLAGVGVVAGFVITGTRLEQARDRRQILYTKQLASACDTIRTAYGVNPSLKRALEAVAQYGQSPIRDDFQEILVAASQERFIEGLQLVAERRRSIVFDTVATALIRASEASGEVNDMLVRLATSTRQTVDAYEEAIVSQINARSNVQWGAFGPWMIFAVFRLLTLALSSGVGSVAFSLNSGFFITPAGNFVALAAAYLTLSIYRHSMHVAQRGLVVRRIGVSETRIVTGQRPIQAQSAMSAQSQPSAIR